MSQSHGIAIWDEASGSGANPTSATMVLKNVSGAWMHVVGDVPDAIPIDLGDGVFVITGVTDPTFNPTAPRMQFKRVRGAVIGF